MPWSVVTSLGMKGRKKAASALAAMLILDDAYNIVNVVEFTDPDYTRRRRKKKEVLTSSDVSDSSGPEDQLPDSSGGTASESFLGSPLFATGSSPSDLDGDFFWNCTSDYFQVDGFEEVTNSFACFSYC